MGRHEGNDLTHAIPASCVRVSAVILVLIALAVSAGCSAGGGAANAPRPVEAPAMAEESFAGAGASEESFDEASVPLDARKIIARARMEMVVEDTESSVEAITALADEFGGYISQANLYRDTYGGRNLLRGSLSLRVPADTLQQFMSRLEGMALEVRSTSLDREDVTDQYSDIEAQLRNLNATENELRELLAEVRARPNATSEDILAVHRDLTEIRGEIEQLQGRQNMLDNLIALSTLDVTLIPDEASRPVVEGRWQPGTVMRNAARALVSTLQFFGEALIWILVYLLPILLLALIPLAIIVWVIRTLVLRRRRKRETAATSPDA